MKVFTYDYYIPYGSGHGVVIAESIEEAEKMIRAQPYHEIDDLQITEIDITKTQLVDMSWEE